MPDQLIPGRRVLNFSEHAEPGDFSYYVSAKTGNKAGLHFNCPCGCDAVLGVDFSKWTWDGNLERPTVKPSIQHLSGCRWHGFLEEGTFRTV